ncbi:hypothetical protein [Geminocystis sp. NIES-3709]|uniref:hypothetical protein n=1 Tax=Geminocystis sp. NIES-3709 TaxID=1617448 RepID=UPI0005FC7844|nr:hypothetical protein [Geminocystis sp. NIES-3709]BAQ65067.1 hypothetical protein GM3709_1832 [Geminocystis sp. NIES-3709]
MNNLRKFLVGAGIVSVGAIGTKMAVDYFQNRQEEQVRDESLGDAQPESAEEVAYAIVESNSVQDFLDKSFGNTGRYVPNRPAKIFDYQGKQYMVIWAKDNQLNKNQMLAFLYTEKGRDLIASVGYTSEKTDYNLHELSTTPFAIKINGQKLTSGKAETDGTENVDFVLA